MQNELPVAFTLAQAQQLGWSKDAIYRLFKDGDLERIGRGVYVSPGSIDLSLETLAGVTAVHRDATLCLTSALVAHNLSDAILTSTDIALPRGIRYPAGFIHVTWHSFSTATFNIGRERISALDVDLYCYSAERSIIDCYRLSHLEGLEVADLALKRWLGQSEHTPSVLLSVADNFPQALPRIRRALEVLL